MEAKSYSAHGSRQAIHASSFSLYSYRSHKKIGGQTRPRNYQYLGSPQKGLYPKGPILGMTPAQALIVIQTMAEHSQKWHNGTKSKNIGSSSSNDGLAALVNKLDNLGRDMKKLKESVHAIQIGCQIYEGPYLDKDCPLNEEVRYGEFGRTTPFNGIMKEDKSWPKQLGNASRKPL
ncbi:hypothetical protein Tco_0915181 [Tanacetum coccineum]